MLEPNVDKGGGGGGGEGAKAGQGAKAGTWTESIKKEKKIAQNNFFLSKVNKTSIFFFFLNVGTKCNVYLKKEDNIFLSRFGGK